MLQAAARPPGEADRGIQNRRGCFRKGEAPRLSMDPPNPAKGVAARLAAHRAAPRRLEAQLRRAANPAAPANEVPDRLLAVCAVRLALPTALQQVALGFAGAALPLKTHRESVLLSLGRPQDYSSAPLVAITRWYQ